MPIWMKENKNGTSLLLHIQPGASKSELAGVHGDRLKLKIKAPPRDGEANEAVIEFIAEKLSLPKSKVHLIRGQTSRQKEVSVELSAAETEKRLGIEC